MMSHGTAIADQRRRRDRDVERALDDRVEPLQRHVVEVDDRDAVEILEPRAQRDELQQVGHDLDVDAFAARRLDQVEQLHVLFERQRDVQVIDAFSRRTISAASLRRPSSGRPR